MAILLLEGHCLNTPEMLRTEDSLAWGTEMVQTGIFSCLMRRTVSSAESAAACLSNHRFVFLLTDFLFLAVILC